MVFGHAEFRLQHRDDKFSRGEVVINEDDLVQARPFGLGLDPGFRLGDGIGHSGKHLLTIRQWPSENTISRAAVKPAVLRWLGCSCGSLRRSAMISAGLIPSVRPYALQAVRGLCVPRSPDPQCPDASPSKLRRFD